MGSRTISFCFQLPSKGVGWPSIIDWIVCVCRGVLEGENRTTEPTSHTSHLAWNHLAHGMSRKISLSTNKITCLTLPKGFTELCTKGRLPNLNSRNGFGQLAAEWWRASRDMRLAYNRCAGHLTEPRGARRLLGWGQTNGGLFPPLQRGTHSFIHSSTTIWLPNVLIIIIIIAVNIYSVLTVCLAPY